MWLIKKAASLVDTLHVVVGVNPTKRYYFDANERARQVQTVLSAELSHDEFSRVTVVTYNGLLISYAQTVDAHYIIRGIRDTNDFVYEHQIQLVNKKIAQDVDTVFLIPPVEFTEVSSSTVKGLVGFEGWKRITSEYVHPVVIQAFEQKLIMLKGSDDDVCSN